MGTTDRHFDPNKILEVLMLSKDATAIYTSEQLIIQMANDAMIGFWGKDRSVIGKSFIEAVPELVGQPFFGLLQEVWRTGITYEATDTAAQLRVDGRLQWSYYDFVYRAIKNEQGETYCILHTATDVTERHFHKQAIDDGKLREQNLNEELSASNEELVSANEEIVATNEELSQSRQELLELNEKLEAKVDARTRELTDSEHNTRAIVESAPFPIGVYIGREMRIQLANKSIIDIFGKGPDVIGKRYADILPELDNQDIFKQLDQVFTTGAPFHARNQRVDLVAEGALRTYYFNYSFTPLFDKDGHVYGVMNTAADVTDAAIAMQKVEQSERNLYNLVRQAPVGMCILKGRPLFVEVVNDAFLQIVGKKRSQFNDTPYWVVNAEAAPYYEPITDRVLETGKPYYANEHEIMLIRDGKEEIVHVDFVYEPIKDADGKAEAIMIVAIEVTEKVNARKIIERASDELAAFNEELTAANEEMTATNEELASVNEELAAANDELINTKADLERINNNLAASEARFRSLIQQAPVAMFILNGREQRIETMNNRMFKMLGKGPEIIGKTYPEALPEFEGQPFFQLIDNVFTSGHSYYGNELLAKIEHEGEIRDGYYNFIYEPVKDYDDVTNSVMCVAIDVTEQVEARKKVERAEESLRMATESGELGTWYLNGKSGQFIASPRFNEIFGFSPEEQVPYEVAVEQIQPEYRQVVLDAVSASLQNYAKFNVEYPVTGFNDQKQRWVRSLGRTVEDKKNGNYITGVMADITEQKMDDIRKNDFIGMVSHELKTPLTSLNAIIQVANSKLKSSTDAFLSGAMEKAFVQVRRMSAMINGFLNVSRLESGKLLIEKSVFDIDQLINEVIDEAQMTVSTHTIKLEPCNPVQINADRDKIGSVISNLISNAVKYSPKVSEITVHCIIKGSNVVVSVQDEGIGIDPQDADKIFDRYYRVQTALTQHVSGFGIGLYLSAEIIQRHGGRIWVKSEPGKGSTFYFELPVGEGFN